MDDEALEGHLPASFGGGRDTFDPVVQMESARRQPLTSSTEKSRQGLDTKSNSSDDPESSSEDDDDDEDEYPISHEIVFKTHDRAVTTLTCDPSGSRLITGSTDCTLKFHDFATQLPNTMRAFKSNSPTAT